MAARALDLEVLRHGRPEDEFQAHGDPEDTVWLQGRLRGWLTARKWDRALWGQFEIVARDAGKSKQLAKVRMLCPAAVPGRCGTPPTRSGAPVSSRRHSRTPSG